MDGATIRREIHRGRRGNAHVRFVCECKYHENCIKRRGGGRRETQHLGSMEPFGFLAVWLGSGRGCTTATQHMNINLSRDVDPDFHLQRGWLLRNGYA